MSYVSRNLGYYDAAVYDPKYVETIIVRTFHKYVKPALAHVIKPRLLDFGCGTATPTGFYKEQGFDIYGVDFSAPEIAIAKQKFPAIANHFAVCEGAPSDKDMFFGGDFDMLLAMQSLYYFNNADTEVRMCSLANMLKPGAVVWISMMASGHNWFKRSKPAGDGLYKVPSGEGAIPTELGHHFINFTESEAHLRRKFSMFSPIFIGYYDHDVGEGSTKHWLFIGRKP